MKELQTELIGLMKTADLFRGIHTQVYKLEVFSSVYLRNVKQGKSNIEDTKENRNRVRQLINAYETLLHQYKTNVGLGGL